MQLELASGQSPEEREQSHERMLISTRRIVRLANQLLALARAEGEAEAKQFTVLDISVAIETMAIEWLSRADAKHIDLGLDLHTAHINGSVWQIQEMLANLVDNAIRYTPAYGNVTIRCGQAGEEVIVAVEDNGPGISPDQHENVFNRFFRLEEGPDGCGLGLAIVLEIVRHHGGQIMLKQPESLQGTLVQISFPVS